MNSTRVLFLGCGGYVDCVRQAAGEAGLTLDEVATWADLLSQVQMNRCCIVLAEHAFSGSNPADLLDAARRNSSPAMVIFLMGGTGGASEAVRLVKMGAYQCVDPQTEVASLVQILEDAKDEVRCRTLAVSAGPEHWRKLLVGASPCMQDMARIIELVASRRCTVLISGETGTGKEMAARAIHMASDRSRLPMVALNCSAIPEHLLEAELFGHTKGAFTGAVAPRAGRFEEAHNSTLFLDEVGDMPVDLQAKLLRVLQERELQRLGRLGNHQGERPRDCSVQRGSGGTSETGQVSGRPVLPPERGAHSDAALAGTFRRHPPSGAPFRGKGLPHGRHPDKRDLQ